ncbi:MAG: ATP-binding protein, partial [Pseudoflavonifractor sp.]
MKNLLEIEEDLTSLTLPIGLVIAEASPRLPILYANDMFVELLGFSNLAELMETYEGSAWAFVSPADVERLAPYADTRMGTTEAYEIIYRARRKDGSYIWMNQNARHTKDDTGRELVFAYCTDMTDRKQAEHALRESEARYAAAVKASNINIWEYNYATDTMTIFSKSPRVNPKDNIVKNYTRTAVEEGHISAESAPLLMDMIARLKNGAPEVTADLWIRQNPEDEFWCERVVYTNSFDEDGKPDKAYCVGRDITKEKEAEKRYHDERSYREAMQKATMASINVNLSKNTILDYKSIFPEVSAHMEEAETAQGYFEQVYTELSTPEMRAQAMAVFNREALLRQFAKGQTTLSMELTREIEGRSYWTVVTAHMMKKQENNDVVAFLYSTDLTNERTMQQVMNAIAKTDYDFLVVVDARRDTAVRYSEKPLGHDYVTESQNFEAETRGYLRKFICPQDLPHVLKEVTLANILAQLEQKTTYSVLYGVPAPEGGICSKQLRFSYINRAQKSILMTRVDITAAVEEQEKRNQALVEAVQMAEHANAAKSDFLSRISHEIRTPMNAIMGMDQLIAQRLDDPVFVGECIEKSQYASRYLLQLLNDILDMSKIERGQVTLKNELIACRPFLDAVSTIVQNQAAEKGVGFHVSKSGNCGDHYLGDSVRLQQILINILTNAVKFTPGGGNVSLSIAQIGTEGERALVRFTISDTGIGISPAFMPQLFRPFSQEHTGTRSGYGGSGLGLAISRNLAQLMGGDIFVESREGEGSVFRVEIPLGLPEEGSALAAEAQPETDRVYDFTGRCFLLVEDHRLNIMVARKLLEFKNATVEVAENGQIGLDLFAAQPEHFDAVLMDIRMPVMDGLQAARAIRGLDHAKAKKVPIIAMSANAFDDDMVKSKEAGMDAHLAKPIEAELLYRTLAELL